MLLEESAVMILFQILSSFYFFLNLGTRWPVGIPLLKGLDGWEDKDVGEVQGFCGR